MEPLPSTPLDRARQALAGMHARPCRISHERVLFRNGTAARRSVGEETLFVRVGLCPWQERANQLACAHTMARHNLHDLVTSLEQLQLLTADAADHTSVRISQLADVIHAADWSRGDVEAALARAVEAEDHDACFAHRQKIEALEQQHTAAAAELEEILLRLRHLTA